MTTDANRCAMPIIQAIMFGLIGAFSMMCILDHYMYPPHLERACKNVCFPTVHRRIVPDCYCADGKNWEFKATDEELDAPQSK